MAGDLVTRKEMTSADVSGGGVELGKEVSNVEMSALLKDFALGIARGQMDLDRSSMTVAELMSGNRILRDTSGRLLNRKGLPSDNVNEVPVVFDSRVYFGYDKIGDQLVPNRVSMMELGFTPTFYQFVDTVIELKIAIKITRNAELHDNRELEHNDVLENSTSTSHSGGAFNGFLVGGSSASTVTKSRTVTRTIPVNTRYSSKFNYSAEASSLLRTKLVPVPPPAILEERIRALMEKDRAIVLAEEAAEAAAAAPEPAAAPTTGADTPSSIEEGEG